MSGQSITFDEKSASEMTFLRADLARYRQGGKFLRGSSTTETFHLDRG